MSTWSVAKLAERFNPFVSTVWLGLKGPITRKEVLSAVEESRLLKTPSSEWSANPVVWNRTQHAERVAWFVVHSWDDAIEIDVGIESLGCYVDWWVLDGNHRLAAAIFRGDESILVSPSGDMAVFEEFEVR